MPEIFADRLPVRMLGERAPEVAALAHKSLGPAYELNETVHFCGVIGNRDKSAIFIPRNFSGPQSGDAARLTMRVLERYGRETPGRSGESPGETEAVSILPLIRDLADDFLRYGLFSERIRYHSRDSGKSDWKRTIASEIPLISKTGVPVYAVPRTTRLLDSYDHPLTRIQAKLIAEISARHGWWLGSEFMAACTALSSIPEPALPREGWPVSLRAALTALYANRPMKLARQLLAYLDGDMSARDGAFMAGVSNFEWVWEDMLRRTLTGIDSGWNERLPKPAYRDNEGRIHSFSKGMEMDMVMRQASHYTILDAKYYGASGLNSVPRTGDIVKQMMYETVLTTVLSDRGERATVSSAFIFPGGGTQATPFVASGLSDGAALDKRFPEIRIIYQDIEAAMKAYAGRYKIELEG